ncbi:hypothetical protein [Candidatus Nitronereus thalassa]|uniref:Uncharacterized protein n=1 Tax=Candidatus Nitronereus thalassa TaxID=3020898 RepID=A0ABU3K8V3_9BACT|nr:hypothetical protein [Candidatus Nitronereus thalassa]MDT7042844.1 hypothetical protein [Candidatus Nitronereus thalassa]
MTDNLNLVKQILFYTLRKLPRVLVLSWVALWIMVFPLIHVHPEADHAHGGAQHTHGGLAHSVLSQDLPCEFGKDSHPHQHSDQETHLVAFPGHTHGHSHALSHSEITLSALNPSSDGSLKKQLVDSFGAIDQNSSYAYDLAWGNVSPQENRCYPNHFIQPYFSRPPPPITI